MTVLVNGLPMVHVELKRRGVDIREAFNQIDRYQRDSFWAGSGLFEYVQLFVISNGTLTKYYSQHHPAPAPQRAAERRRRPQKTSNSFEFTSWWADATNRPIQDLTGFAKTFFAKHTLLNILTRYCVLTADRMLLVMRPYQIVATERILQTIEISTNYKQLGTVAAGGYVWHTTGSGKTLTCFKTAQLASRLPSVDKVLFVVDRKDLDYQTMREYDRFEKGAANSNTSTAVLKRQLEDPDARIIITTIQKLATFIAANKGHAIYDGHVVIIFDECHRSQFGDMHTAITKAFKRYNLFGFTGTPIFADNAGTRRQPAAAHHRAGVRRQAAHLHDRRRDQRQERPAVPHRLHQHDQGRRRHSTDKQVSAIDTERALLAPERIAPGRRLHRWSTSTRRRSARLRQSLSPRRGEQGERPRLQRALRDRLDRGGQALLRRSSRCSRQELPPDRRLKVGLIYSYAANEAVEDGLPRRGGLRDRRARRRSSRDFLETRSRTTTLCSARASTPRPTSSRTTTRTCRCG